MQVDTGLCMPRVLAKSAYIVVKAVWLLHVTLMGCGMRGASKRLPAAVAATPVTVMSPGTNSGVASCSLPPAGAKRNQSPDDNTLL